ncbi:unnamed protein product [Gongylonema pulchrum]|uniref:Ribosomal_S10 domain-containing protein n=1 Tax=Gongylonema pulchrum TaxID=637853 RepID=A0A183DJW0_9BILA|nr:unnamed protein product [Gongylonema pulchrum]
MEPFVIELPVESLADLHYFHEKLQKHAGVKHLRMRRLPQFKRGKDAKVP